MSENQKSVKMTRLKPEELKIDMEIYDRNKGNPCKFKIKEIEDNTIKCDLLSIDTDFYSKASDGLYHFSKEVYWFKKELNELHEEEKQYSFEEMINFVKWYSGMKRESVISAYNRYLKEEEIFG